MSTSAPTAPLPPLPLAGLKVVEFTHMVMGPTCGMMLADLGADVLKVEPIEGDRTRHLLGAGIGFFPLFNRNKKSIRIDLRHPEGAAAARRLCLAADVVAENFKPGSLAKYGLDYEPLAAAHPRLIYASLKGFLPGPYEHRTALDEVVQMMGGLFGAIGILGALVQCGITGRGMEVQSALFENNVFLVGQHMLQAAISGRPPDPMPNRVSPWAVYDVFTVKDGEQIFLAAVSDSQWPVFCDALGWPDLKADPALATNNQRVEQRASLLATLRERLANRPAAELAALMERAGLPFAPIRKPAELLEDPHLLATGGLADITLTDGPKAGQTVKTTLFPITLEGARLPVRHSPPKSGEHTREALAAVGYAESEIARLIEIQAVA